MQNRRLEGIQVIVSDNASTDQTPEILKNWENHLDLHVIRQPQTLPMQDHFNKLLDQVKTEKFMVLCHDDYLADPQALWLANQCLDTHPQAPAVYCNLQYVNENRRLLATRTFARDTVFSANEAGRQTINMARNMFGIALGIRTAALEDLRYDPQFHYTMDVDLSWSMARGGVTFCIFRNP